MNRLRTTLSAAGTTLVALLVLYPRATHAEEVPDYERRGEYEENGMRFGAIVVRGQLVPASGAPGGWALVRTFENTSDEAAVSTVEERILRSEDMPEARVGGTPIPVLVRTQVIKLGPHEKRRVGITLPASLAEQINAGLKAKARAEAVRSRAALADDSGRASDGELTYMTFYVEYWKPLAHGQTAELHPAESLTHPARMPGPPPRPGSDLAALGL